MFLQGHVVVTMLTLTAMLLLSATGQYNNMTTSCGQDVIIPPDNDVPQLTVNVTFGQPQPSGAMCSWVIPSFNSSTRSRILLNSVPPPLACGKHAITLFEFDPAASDQTVQPNPLTVTCNEQTPSVYGEAAVARPGYSVRVVLKTSSALPADFMVFFRLAPTSFADLCPEDGRKVMVGTAGEYGYEHNTRFSLNLPTLVGRIPDNMTCRWEFKSAFGEVAMLHLKTYGSKSSQDAGTCPGNDRLVIGEEGSSDRDSSTLTIPYCKDPGVDYRLTGLTGQVFVTLHTDETGGAFKDLYIEYWFLDPCPSSRELVTSSADQEGVVKGISHQASDLNQKKTCSWYFLSPEDHVVKLTGLQINSQLQQSCDEGQDYLLLDERRVSLCRNGSAGDGVFPIWSEDRTLDMSFHSLVTSPSKWFLLQHRAVRKGQCQGNPDKRTVGSGTESVTLRPIQPQDDSEGEECQWLFRAKIYGHVVVVEVGHTTSNTDTIGVSFDEDTCSYDRFSVYSGDSVNDQTRINATCRTESNGRSYIVYTSNARTMLFVYHRNPDVQENGFVMAARQIRDPATSGTSPVMRVMNGLDSVVLFFLAFMLALTSFF